MNREVPAFPRDWLGLGHFLPPDESLWPKIGDSDWPNLGYFLTILAQDRDCN